MSRMLNTVVHFLWPMKKKFGEAWKVNVIVFEHVVGKNVKANQWSKQL